MNTFEDISFNQAGHKYDVFRPSTLAFDTPKNSKKSVVIVDGQHEVKFDKRSPVTAAIKTGMGMEAVERALMDSRLFTINDALVDISVSMRPDAKHFVHSESNIRKMVEHVGTSTRSIKHSYQYNDLDSEGGTFDVNIGYDWSPFKQDISTYTDLTRLACDNLMEMNNPVMNFVVPMINAWEDNIAISNEALRHAFDTKIRPLMATMPDTKISMWQLGALRNVLARVVKDTDNIVMGKLQALETISNRVEDCLYQFQSMSDNVPVSYTRLIDAPVSTFDAYNMLTEINSHYLLDSDSKVTAMSNDLLFNQRNVGKNGADMLEQIQKLANEESFENVDRAFFGVAH